MTAHHPKTYSNLFWALLLLGSIGVSAFLGRELIFLGESNSSIEPHSGPIRISTLDWVGYYPMAAAYKAGYLKEELSDYGVELELITYSDLGVMTDAIRTGRTQGSFGVLADFVVMAGLDIPIRAVLVTNYSQTDYLLANQRIKKVADLAGKTIGIDDRSPFSEYFVTRSLELQKVSLDKIQFRTVASSDVPEALARGEIDAGHTWEPHLSRGLKMGSKVILSSSDRPTDIIDCLVLRREVLLRPELADGIIRAHFRGLDLLRKDPERFANLVAEHYKTSPAEVLRILQGPTRNLSLEENIKAFEPNGTLDQQIQLIHRFFTERGLKRPERYSKAILDADPVRRLEAALRKSNANASDPADNAVPPAKVD